MLKALFAAISFLLSAAGAAAQGGPVWTVDAAQSTIDWTAKWNTTPIHGGFERFSADIVFDPNALESAHALVRVDITSVYMTGQDARATLIDENWFAASDWPEATFETLSFRHIGSGRYEADARLVIRGIERRVALPFKLTIEGKVARMEGSLVLNRHDFGLGKNGDIAKAVAPEVAVAIRVTARRE